MPVQGESSGPGLPAAGPEVPDRVEPGATTALLEALVGGVDGFGIPGVDEPRPGERVGRFELLREIGRGGFGVVYEARDTVLGRDVALKLLRPSRHNEVPARWLVDEAEAAAQLQHPNIVALHDLGVHESRPYLVLELLRGRTLADRMRQSRFTVEEALEIGIAVARGLAHAHGRGVMHRDLKPANVFLCDDGAVKILDFGLSQILGTAGSKSGGTPGYMAPEQWRQESQDARTDVFAFGVLLFELLTGLLPYAIREGRSAVLDAAGPPVPSLPGLRKAVAMLVARCLEPSPDDRPRTGVAILDDLSRAVARTGRVSRRALVAGIASVLVVGAIGAGLVARRLGTAPSRLEPSVAVMPFDDLSPQRDEQYFSDGLAEEILNALTHVEGLHVAGRASSFTLKKRKADLRTIGDQLRVGAVLEGSIRRLGSRVRITTQLVGIRDGFHLWSETYDREVKDIFAVQDEIARAVASALRVKLVPGRALTTFSGRGTASTEAYQQYLIGNMHYAEYTPTGFRHAAGAYERAIAADPLFAAAWARLAFATFRIAMDLPTHEERETVGRRGIEAASRAIALDPQEALAYLARGWARTYEGRCDWQGAVQDNETALRLSPGDATVHRLHALTLVNVGRLDDANEHATRAVELDPLLASNWMAKCWIAYVAGRFAEARAAARRGFEIAPDYLGFDVMLPQLALLEGDAKTALAEFDQLKDSSSRLWGIALAQYSLGNDEASRTALDNLVARLGSGSGNAELIAEAYAWRGEYTRAFEWLERAADRHEEGIVAVRHDQVYRTLRQDPRYEAFVQKHLCR